MTGVTVKPARRDAPPLAFLTTNPDCSSRFSTLQSAHSPVRGQSGPAGVLEAATFGLDALTAAVVVALDEPVPAFSDEEREHPDSAADATITKAVIFLIEIKDRDSAQAPRLLLLDGPQEGR